MSDLVIRKGSGLMPNIFPLAARRAQHRAERTAIPAIWFGSDGKARCYNPLLASDDAKEAAIEYVRNYNANLRKKNRS